MRFQVLGCALALAATVVNAQVSTFCPSGGNTGVCYNVNVAANTEKDLFFQVTAPTSMAWVAFGQGSAMAGSNIFVIYQDAAGMNVTLSPRLGTGHDEPQSDTAAMVTLLSGSGVANGMMTANVKCSNCQSWNGGSMDLTSSSANFLYAYKGGSMMSDSVAASIDQHDDQGVFQLNLQAATGGDGTTNPFATITAANNTGSTSTNSNNSTTNSTASMDATMSNEQQIADGTIAHGIMGAAAFAILFPSGSIILRAFHFKHVLWVHVGIQILGYLVALALMETGVWIAVNNGEMMEAHPILGLVVVCGLFIQPFLGIGHHVLFKRQGGPNNFTIPHVWWGRILITLGIINGYMGLELSENTTTVKAAYGGIAGSIWVLWMGLSALKFLRGKGNGGSIRDKPSIHRVNSYGD